MADNCSSLSSIYLDNNQEENIIVTNSFEVNEEETKKISVVEHISVKNINEEIIGDILGVPNTVAKILGAKLLKTYSNNYYRIEIPGVLGFDLEVDVKITKLSKNKIIIDLDNFNTFFKKGRAIVEYEKNQVDPNEKTF